MSPRRSRWRCPREHAQDSGWPGIRKCGAGSAWVEAVLLVAPLVVVQASEGRFGVKAEVARAHDNIQRR